LAGASPPADIDVPVDRVAKERLDGVSCGDVGQSAASTEPG
jgi:hypothetical protein